MQSFVLYVTWFAELPYHLSVSSNVTDSRIDKIAILREVELKLDCGITLQTRYRTRYLICNRKQNLQFCTFIIFIYCT